MKRLYLLSKSAIVEEKQELYREENINGANFFVGLLIHNTVILQTKLYIEFGFY